MCDQLKSYIFILGGMSIIGTFLVQIGNYLTYYNQRTREWERATIYLTSDTCTDPFLRSQLGPFNLCEKSEDILARIPAMHALYDVAHDVHLCGHGRCRVFFLDVSANLHKIIIGLGVIAIGMVWVGRRNSQYQATHREYYRYDLPRLQ